MLSICYQGQHQSHGGGTIQLREWMEAEQQIAHARSLAMREAVAKRRAQLPFGSQERMSTSLITPLFPISSAQHEKHPW